MTIDERIDGDPADGEWQAQERALRRERVRAPLEQGTPREQRYRLVARMLAEPPVENLPIDFAASVARVARAQEAVVMARERRFENRLTVALSAVLAVAAIGVMVLYGKQLVAAWAPLSHTSSTVTEWVYVVIGCMGLSLLLQHLRLPRSS